MKKEETKNYIENQNEIIELVSEQVHNHWMIWAKELLQSEPNISIDRRTRWKDECFMDYKDLSEEMKNLDRKFAKEIVKTIFKK